MMPFPRGRAAKRAVPSSESWSDRGQRTFPRRPKPQKYPPHGKGRKRSSGNSPWIAPRSVHNPDRWSSFSPRGKEGSPDRPGPCPDSPHGTFGWSKDHSHQGQRSIRAQLHAGRTRPVRPRLQRPTRREGWGDPSNKNNPQRLKGPGEGQNLGSWCLLREGCRTSLGEIRWTLQGVSGGGSDPL